MSSINTDYSSTVYTGSSTGTQLSAESTTDANSFMKVLLAQLANQNPLEPMEDREFLTQMAQLNSLQELQLIKTALTNMEKSNQTSYAASLIGRKVVAQTGEEEYTEGIVTGTSTIGTTQVLHLDNDTTILLSSVVEIHQVGAEEEEETETTPTSTNSNATTSSAAAASSTTSAAAASQSTMGAKAV